MKITAILLTFLLVLELVKAQCTTSYNLTVNESNTVSCTLCTPNLCYCMDQLKMCGTSLSDFLLDCQVMETVTTPTPSCPPMMPTMCTGSTTTDANANSAIDQATFAATTGVLVVLLILAIIGWVCTCVILKKKGTMNINNTNLSEMQIRYKNEYHNEMGNTQQESSEDQVQQDLRVYDVVNTPAAVHNTTNTNREEVLTEQLVNEQQQMSQNDLPSHRDMESHSDRQNQTRLDDGSQEDQTSTHFYHILEQQSEEHVELNDHKPAAAYEVPVTNMAVHHQ